MTCRFSNTLMAILGMVFIYGSTYCQEKQHTVIAIESSRTWQVIDNFGASDAWAGQFAGNWPDENKNALADWLFSLDTLADGSPKGIGLSLWRYNIGAGSARQGAQSGIRDEWRRAAAFDSIAGTTDERIRGQLWFIEAAYKRGVRQFLGFFNSPPVTLTRNGKAFAANGVCNIDSSNYAAFAAYAVDVIKQLKKVTGVSTGYISPVNEPQWKWSDGGQEGCPYTNAEISSLVKHFNSEIQKSKLAAKIILPETGHIKYLLKDDSLKGKDNQVYAFFDPASPFYAGHLPAVKKTLATHSYFSTSPYQDGVALRKRIRDTIARIKDLTLWQSEYCILGDNAGEISGSKRDLTMAAALYVAKVIHQDLTAANASAWQWWLAVSPYNYKDGLVYIDKNKTGGNYYSSKILWVLGNYSRFIRPGMTRVEATVDTNDLLVSAFKNRRTKELVVVIVNASVTGKTVFLRNEKNEINGQLTTYTTDATASLRKQRLQGSVVVPAQSVVTVVIE